MPYLWPKLAHVLGLTREQLRSLFADDDESSASQPAAHPPPTNQAVALEDMMRRTFVKWGLATTATACPGVSAGNTVGMADVKRLQRAAARLHSLDQRHCGDTLWHAAMAQAHDGVQLLEYGSYTDTVGQHLLTATGRLQVCTGWLAFDAGQHEVARICFTDALAMSRQANDAQTETRALANLALQSNALSRPREAMRYAIGAEHAATGLGSTSWLAAIPQFRLAIGNSLMGNARDADRAIARARRALERDNDAASASEEWSSFLSPLEVDGVEASCAMKLHRPSRAERLLEHAIADYARQCARNLALYRVRLARARVYAGAVDGAVEAAHAALDDLSGEVASWRVGSELDSVAQRLAAYPEVEGVDSFVARYQAVNQ